MSAKLFIDFYVKKGTLDWWNKLSASDRQFYESNPNLKQNALEQREREAAYLGYKKPEYLKKFYYSNASLSEIRKEERERKEKEKKEKREEKRLKENEKRRQKAKKRMQEPNVVEQQKQIIRVDEPQQNAEPPKHIKVDNDDEDTERQNYVNELASLITNPKFLKDSDTYSAKMIVYQHISNDEQAKVHLKRIRDSEGKVYIQRSVNTIQTSSLILPFEKENKQKRILDKAEGFNKQFIDYIGCSCNN